MDAIERLAAFMHDHSLTLVTAESCTAGLIAATLADVPGAGSLLDCAFVVYSPEAKARCLGVSARTLARHNLTSEAVAREMALGACRQSPALVAISNTGVTDSIDSEIPAGTSGGAAAIAALAAPFAGIGFVPTGGVGPKNLGEYLALPSVKAVGGSWMVPRDRVAAGDLAGVRDLVVEAVALASSLRP